jgi:DNA polymerase III subunit gamma/tau
MSESYRALTRKYRPKTFDDVVSQQHIISTLRNAIEQNRISHAYLFCGPRGVGKTTMARVVARLINGVSLDIDGEELSRTLDIIEIDAASNSGVDDVRLLRDGVRVPPQQGRFKVYIIDEVHMLSKAAFNALLKTLEEPPEHVKFIFATTEPHKVLPTVMSRVQRFDFRRIKVSEIVDRLKFICDQEKISIDDASLHLIGRKADGALRDALSIMDQVIAFCGDDIKYDAVLEALNVISNDRLFELTDCVLEQESSRGMQIVHDLLLQGHDIQEFLVALTEHLRNMYFSRFAGGESTLLEVPEEERERLKNAAKAFSEHDLLRMMHLTSEAQIKIRDSQQPRVLLEISILKLIMMDRSESLQTLLAEVRELKKKTDINSEPGAASREQEVQRAGRSEQQSVLDSPLPTPHFPSEKILEIINEDPEHNEKEGQVEQAEKNSSLLAAPRSTASPLPTSHSLDAKDSSPLAAHGSPVKALFGAPAIKKKKSSTQSTVHSSRSSDAQINQEVQKAGNSEQRSEPTPHSPLPTPQSLGNGTRSAASLLPTPDSRGEEDRSPLAARRSTRSLDRDLIESNYNAWIEAIRQGGQQVLALSLSKTRLRETGPDWILIECQDEFIAQLVNENHEKLCNVLGELIKGNVSIKTKVLQRVNTTSTNDPYALLMKLQQEQPIVKSIVEALGAELEY